jgi:uncharacterized membrane protein
MTLEYLRSFRLFDIALFDLILAIAGMVMAALLVHKYTDYDKKTLIMIFVALTIPLGIVVHASLGIDTSLNRMIGI